MNIDNTDRIDDEVFLAKKKQIAFEKERFVRIPYEYFVKKDYLMNFINNDVIQKSITYELVLFG